MVAISRSVTRFLRAGRKALHNGRARDATG